MHQINVERSSLSLHILGYEVQRATYKDSTGGECTPRLGHSGLRRKRDLCGRRIPDCRKEGADVCLRPPLSLTHAL